MACRLASLAWLVCALTVGAQSWIPTPPDLGGVTPTPTGFLAVGGFGSVLTSENGRDWANHPAGTTNRLNGVVLGNGIFVAVGAAGTIATSSDGANWTVQTVGSNPLNAVAFGAGKFLAVGKAGTVLSSTDGKTWQPVSAGTSSDLNAVTFAAGKFVIIGALGTILTSQTGASFTAQSSPDGVSLNAVTFGSGLFVAVGDAPGTHASVITSADGVTWIAQSNAALNGLHAVGYGNGLFTAAGAFGFVESSPDGRNWTQQTVAARLDSDFRGVAFSGGNWALVGELGTIALSPDAITWSLAAGPMPYAGGQVAYGNGLFVTVGQNQQGNGVIATSTDGLLWKTESYTASNRFHGVAFGLGNFVAVGEAGEVATSTDGHAWVKRNVGVTDRLNGVYFVNGRFFILGSGGTLLVSADAVTWTPIDLDFPFFSTDLHAITYAAGKYVLVGSGNILASTDGVNFDGVFSDNRFVFQGVTYGAGRFLAVGANFFTANSGGIVTSTDGSKWTVQSADQYANLNNVAFGDQFVIVGDRGTVLTSPAGTNFTNQSIGETRGYLGAVQGTNDVWVVTGDNTHALVLIPAGGSTPPPPGECVPAPRALVSWWRGEGNAQDSAGQNNGVFQGNAVANLPEKVGLGFVFDGQSAIEVPNNSSLQPPNVSVEAWVLLRELNSPNASVPGLQYIVFKRNSRAVNFEGYALMKHLDNAGVPRFSFQTTSASGLNVVADSTTVVATNSFYHLVGTYDGRKTSLYVNGNLEASVDAPLALDYGDRPLFIGASGEPNFEGKLVGEVDEVSLYNEALTPGEVRSIYQAGSAGKCAPAPVKTVTANTSGTIELPPSPPGLDLVVTAEPATPSAPPVDAKVVINNAISVLRTTLGAAPGSTLELIVNALLDAKVIEVRDGGILVVQGKVIGDVENVAGIVSRDPVLTDKLKSIGSLVEENEPIINALGVGAIISYIQPEITKVFAKFPAGALPGGIHAEQTGTTGLGAIQINGDYTQDPDAILAIAIQGTNYVSGGAQQYDRLEVSGTATLTGKIAFGLLNTSGGTDGAVFQPPTGAVFDVVVANEILATNITIRGPIWGTGLQFVPVIAQFNDGREALRLIATNVAPVLDVQSDENGTKVLFPSNYLGHYVLQATSSLSSPVWQDLPGNSAVVAITTSDRARFFRLKKVE
jgi:hypothetical protein